MRADLHEAVAARLARDDGRYTGARRDLIELLGRAGQPLTVDEIVARAPRQRPSSVYRNLAVFESQGVVRRIAGVGEFARFELTEALVGHHHHHLACRRCGAMIDVQLPHDLETRLDRALAQLARSQGFVVDAHVLDALGVCRACAAGDSGTRRANAGRPANGGSRGR